MARQYHWVITLKAKNEAYTLTGTLQIEPGQTRSDAYQYLYDMTAKKQRMVEPVVLFFSLEPNDFGGDISLRPLHRS